MQISVHIFSEGTTYFCKKSIRNILIKTYISFFLKKSFGFNCCWIIKQINCMASSIESEITNLLMFRFHITNVNWTEMECVPELNKFTFFKKQWTWPELNSFFQIWMWSEFYSSKKGTYNALILLCIKDIRKNTYEYIFK